MEKKFINRYEVTREVISEFFLKRTMFSPFFIAIEIFLLATLVYDFISVLNHPEFGWTNFIICAVYTALIPVIRVFQYKKLVDGYMENEKTEYGEEKHIVSFEITEESFLSKNETNGKTKPMLFSEVNRVQEMKNIVIFIDREKGCVIIKKDAFTEGTYEGFCDFISGKIKKAKKLANKKRMA